MSERKEKFITVDVNQLYAIVSAIKDEIEGLQGLQAQLSDLYERVRRAKESIDAIVLFKNRESFLIPLEPGSLVLSEMSPKDREKFIVNIGLDIYAKLDANEAQRVLSTKESEILKKLEEVSKRLNELAQAYEQYQAILQAAVAKSVQTRQQKGTA